jgi:hypothetical protein
LREDRRRQVLALVVVRSSPLCWPVNSNGLSAGNHGETTVFGQGVAHQCQRGLFVRLKMPTEISWRPALAFLPFVFEVRR